MPVPHSSFLAKCVPSFFNYVRASSVGLKKSYSTSRTNHTLCFSHYYSSYNKSLFPDEQAQEKTDSNELSKPPIQAASLKEPMNVLLNSTRPKRIVVAITGATGVAMGIRILQILRSLGVETHLIISKWGAATMKYETDWEPQEVAALASKVYTQRDVSAPISSGSFQHDGMIVVPCSMKTLASIRIGYTEDLITRAADVSMKERRKVLLVTRETPLSNIHLENMLSLSRDGVIIFPPVPAFYTKPKSIDDVIEQSVGRILDCFGIHTDSFPRWNGINKK